VSSVHNSIKQEITADISIMKTF